MTLTGRKRYRVSWSGKVILQVEYLKAFGDSYGWYEEVPTWRDATAQDITTL